MPRNQISVPVFLDDLITDLTDDDLYLILDALDEEAIKQYCQDRYKWIMDEPEEE